MGSNILDKKTEHDENEHDHDHDHDHEENEEHEINLHGCCNHDIEHKKYDWKHPITHSIKIFVTILIINIIFGCIIEFGFKGEANLSNFLSKNISIA